MNERDESLSIFLVLFLLSVFLLHSAYTTSPGGHFGRGALVLPKTVGFLLLFCSTSFFIKWLNIEKREEEKKKRDWAFMWRFAIALGLLVLYVMFLKKLGFIVVTALYIFAHSLFLVPSKHRNYLHSCIIAIVSSTSIYTLFVKGLNIVLPTGILANILKGLV